MKAAVRGDTRTKRLASRVVDGADNWTGRIIGNVAWAQAVLQHGAPVIMDIVSPRAVTFTLCTPVYALNSCFRWSESRPSSEVVLSSVFCHSRQGSENEVQIFECCGA